MIADEDGWPMFGALLFSSSHDPRWANAFCLSLGVRRAGCGRAVHLAKIGTSVNHWYGGRMAIFTATARDERRMLERSMAADGAD